MLGRYVAVAVPARAADAAAEPALLVCAAALGLSTTAGSLLLAALTVASALGGPLVGAAVGSARDRTGTVTYGGGLVLTGAVLTVLALTLGRVPSAALLPVAVAGGLAQPLFSGGWTARLTGLVPPGNLARAFALDAVTYDLAGILGPALAAAAVALGDRSPLLVAAALAALPLPVLLRTHWPAMHATADVGGMGSGLRLVIGDRALRQITVLSTLQYAGMAARTVGAPVLAATLTGHAAYAGVLFAVSAAGSLGGSVLLTRMHLPWSPRTVARAATAVAAGTVAALAACPSWWAAVALFAVGGCVDAPLLTSVFRIRSDAAPENVRTTVFTTAASLKTGGYALALALFGSAVGGHLRLCLLAGAAVQVLGLLVTSAPEPARAT